MDHGVHMQWANSSCLPKPLNWKVSRTCCALPGKSFAAHHLIYSAKKEIIIKGGSASVFRSHWQALEIPTLILWHEEIIEIEIDEEIEADNLREHHYSLHFCAFAPFIKGLRGGKAAVVARKL